MQGTRGIIVVLTLVLGVLLVFASCAPAAETPMEFYKNKKLEFNVPYDAGTPEDLIPRAVGPLIAEYVGASGITVVNRTGGSGVETWNRVYAAEPDGLTLGFGSASTQAILNIFEDQAARFETDKYAYLIGLPSSPLMFIVQAGGPIKSIDDLKGIVPRLGVSRITGNYALVMLTIVHAFGLQPQMVSGMGGSERILLLTRGELEGSISDVPLVKEKMEGGTEIEPLFVISPERVKEFPQIPTMRELLPGASQEILDMIRLGEDVLPAGDNILTTPGVPANRLDFLRQAVVKATEEKRAEIADIREFEIDRFQTGDEISAMVAELLSPESRAKLKAVFEDLIAKYSG